jgi:hypothetical protein
LDAAANSWGGRPTRPLGWLRRWRHPVVARMLGSVLDSMKEALELVIRCGL